MKITKVGLADDHILLRSALATLINNFGNCEVVIQASTGRDLIKQVMSGTVPDIVLMDLSMPEMDGYETAIWLKNNSPSLHVLMLTMYNTELTLIRLLQAGVESRQRAVRRGWRARQRRPLTRGAGWTEDQPGPGVAGGDGLITTTGTSAN